MVSGPRTHLKCKSRLWKQRADGWRDILSPPVPGGSVGQNLSKGLSCLWSRHAPQVVGGPGDQGRSRGLGGWGLELLDGRWGEGADARPPTSPTAGDDPGNCDRPRREGALSWGGTMSQDHASASWWSPSSVFPAGPGLSSKDTRLVFSAVPSTPHTAWDGACSSRIRGLQVT